MIVALVIHNVLMKLLYFLIPSEYTKFNLVEMFFSTFGDASQIILILIGSLLFIYVTEEDGHDIHLPKHRNDEHVVNHNNNTGE